MAKRVLSIEIGKHVTKIVEIDYKKKIHMYIMRLVLEHRRVLLRMV